MPLIDERFCSHERLKKKYWRTTMINGAKWHFELPTHISSALWKPIYSGDIITRIISIFFCLFVCELLGRTKVRVAWANANIFQKLCFINLNLSRMLCDHTHAHAATLSSSWALMYRWTSWAGHTVWVCLLDFRKRAAANSKNYFSKNYLHFHSWTFLRHSIVSHTTMVRQSIIIL